MTLRELFAVVAPAKLETYDSRLFDALHDSEGSDAPLLVRLFTMIGTWIGALLLAFVFVALDLHRATGPAFALSLASFGGAIALSRPPIGSLAQAQLVAPLAVGAQGLVLAAMLELGADDPILALTCTLLQVVTMSFIRVLGLQVISAIAAVGCATWTAVEFELPIYGLWVALPVCGLAFAAWIFEVRWASRLGRTWMALAYGLPMGAIIPLVAISLDADPAFAARNLPGLGIALLWLLLAHLRKSIELQGLGLIQLGGFLFLLYHQLDTTLLIKSLWVIGSGVLALLGAWVIRSREGSDPTKPKPERRSRWLPAIALALSTSALVIYPSLQKERILAEGRTVFLPLAPVGPRSLMQGDSMVLRYALESEVAESVGPVWVPGNQPRNGKLVIRVDERGIGHFARFQDWSWDRDELMLEYFGSSDRFPSWNHDELLLDYRIRGAPTFRIGGGAFFFEEGSAHVYANARYGELVLADHGEAVLVGLRDENLRPLGKRLHDR